jgi:hypothetical protein
VADNTVLSAAIGTGINLNTDELADSTHVQKIKLMDGTADSTGIIAAGAGTAATALRVELPTDGTGQVKIAAGSAVIGEVSIGAASTASADLAKAEDQASTSGMVGVGALAVRKATPADTSGTDGDFEFLQLDNGKLWVAASGSVAHDTALGSVDKPLLLGGVAQEMDGTTLAPVAVAASDITYMRADRDGRQLINASHPASKSYNLNSSSAQTATVIQAATASMSIYITSVNCSALTAQTLNLHDEDDNILIPIQYLGANTGSVRIDLSASPIKLVVNKALEVTSTAAVATSYLIQYYIAP